MPQTDWSAEIDRSTGVDKHRLFRNGRPGSFSALFECLETDAQTRAWYTRMLADSGFSAFYWEHPPFCESSFADAAEFVLVDAPHLAGLDADRRPFAAQFEKLPAAPVVRFRNLGGDAELVVPRGLGCASGYAHLADFVRRGPVEQIDALWSVTARAVRQRIGPDLFWLSTAGTGVFWLHVRLDSFPKYYSYRAYTQPGTG